MKRLVLMRHAKSDWSHELVDHDRPLNGRGRRSAEALGNWLRGNGYLPDAVLCSTARRTRDTLDRLNLPEAQTRFERRLYHAPPQTMLDVLKEASGDTVLMVGHNPGIAGFAVDLVASPPAHPRFADYPTCATLVVDFALEEWDMLKTGTGAARAFTIPRELTD